VYQTSQPSTFAQNRVVIKARHCIQSVMLFLCVPDHLVGVVFRASSIASNIFCVGTTSSKSEKKVSKGFRPSKVGVVVGNPHMD
jgi:hypothetical protein